MRTPRIAYLAITIVLATGCASELTVRPAAADPTNAASSESPFHEPPKYSEDPLLTATPPSPAKTSEPAAEPHHHEQPPPAAREYTCPMHPEVRTREPGKCPKCGMTLVPVEPKGRDK